MDFTANMVADARLFDQNGLIVPPPLGLALQSSWGRKQPYAGHPSQVVAQNVIPVPVAGLSHTFFRHNGQGTLLTNAGLTLTQPFDWLVHLDRVACQSGRAFSVSAYKPHELMQQFVITTSNQDQKFQQARQLEQRRHTTASRIGSAANAQLVARIGGRRAHSGRVNVNTIWDQAVFQAVCDANGANAFNPSDIQTIWNKLRSLAGRPAARLRPVLDQDCPFWSSAAPIDLSGSMPSFQTESGVNNTLYRLRPVPINGKIVRRAGPDASVYAQ